MQDRLDENHSYLFDGKKGDLSAGVPIRNTAETTAQPYYVRLLEIMALQLFGHAKARAAIANDSSFKDTHATLRDHLHTEFGNVQIKNDFFEQYVQLDRLDMSQNDVTVAANFNLYDSKISVTTYLTGAVLDIADQVGDMANGNASAVFGTRIPHSLVNSEDGTYNIHVLTIFDGLAANLANSGDSSGLGDLPGAAAVVPS
jgi:hypothetical protein